jgi:SAM-dependent methyltransferase
MDSIPKHQLQSISEKTIGHYNGRAEAFWEGTRDHDVTQNMEALIAALVETGSGRILDFGCGPGRDVAAFAQRGFDVTGLDGSAEFCHMARQFSGRDVLHQDFLSLDLPAGAFDGIFANASLFHVPGQELPRVLSQLHTALDVGGVLFSSNPRGQGQEGWNGERYGAYHSFSSWKALLETAGFSYVHHYYRPDGLPREQQPWLASVWRKV